jgi:two-component system, sensor histidine kinase YesM
MAIMPVKNNNRSILKRLLIFFIGILLPLYILGIAIYLWGMNAIRMDLISSILQQTSSYIQDLQKEVDRIQILQYYLTEDPNLLDLINKTGVLDYNRVEKISNLHSNIVSIQNSSQLIDEVLVYIKPLNYVVRSRGNVDKYDPETFANFEKLDKGTIVLVNDTYVSLLAPVWQKIQKNRLVGMIEVRLSTDRIEETLKEQDAYPSSGGILYLNRECSVVIKSRKDAFVEQMENLFRIRDAFPVNSTKEYKFEGKNYIVTALSTNNLLQFTMVHYTAEADLFRHAWIYKVLFIVYIMIGLAVAVFYSIYLYKYIRQPLHRLVKAFEKLENGVMDQDIHYYSNDEFAYIYYGFNKMTQKLRQMIEQDYKKEILTQKAELKQLQTQINPHFLYNSFFILHRMVISGNGQSAGEFSEQLGTYFKYITRNSLDDIPLRLEVEHARIYANIQNLRFSKRIEIHFAELPEQYGDIKVPRLIIQPLLENAFEHGLAQKEKGGILEIGFFNSNHLLEIVIEDNGENISLQEIEEMNRKLEMEGFEITGVVNIHKRLRLKFGKTSGLRFLKGEYGGLKAIISIDKKEDEDDTEALDCG